MAKNSKIDEVIAAINKKYGEDVVIRAKDLKVEEVSRLNSGSLYLDRLLGVDKEGQGGWPMGRIIELYGPQMSGKSSLCMKTLVEAQKRGLLCAWFDTEKSFEIARAKQMGVDTDNLFLTQESGGERVIEMMCDLLRGGEVKVIVVDSLAGLVPKAEIEKSMEESNRMALVAQMMSQGLRKLNALNKSGALIIFINQLRTNPGATYGNPEYTPGGKALGYAASIRVELRTGEWIIEDKKKIGQIVKFKVSKNKTSTPHEQGTFQFMYEGQIDQIDELISVGELLGSIMRKGAYYYLTPDQGFHGRDDLYRSLKDDVKLFEQAKSIVFGGTNEKEK